MAPSVLLACSESHVDDDCVESGGIALGEEDVVTGRYNNSSPPGLSSGTLTARVGASGDVVVTNLQFAWSSSHVGVLQFSASGDGVADKTQIVGTLSGEESFTTTFGGFTGSRYACSGTRMPFTFTRRD